jgi:hypothetical protein
MYCDRNVEMPSRMAVCIETDGQLLNNSIARLLYYVHIEHGLT